MVIQSQISKTNIIRAQQHKKQKQNISYRNATLGEKTEQWRTGNRIKYKEQSEWFACRSQKTEKIAFSKHPKSRKKKKRAKWD